LDPVFEEELNMRLLIQTTAPWLRSLDRNPVALKAPAAILRTALTGSDDAAWQLRCPKFRIVEIPGQHHTLFESENIAVLRGAFISATGFWSEESSLDQRQSFRTRPAIKTGDRSD
jgi:hypothetical protein